MEVGGLICMNGTILAFEKLKAMQLSRCIGSTLWANHTIIVTHFLFVLYINT